MPGKTPDRAPAAPSGVVEGGQVHVAGARDRFAGARAIADAVLYEGYVLYPYRASAIKNRYRWQFGVVAPRGYAERSGTDPWFMQAELLVESAGDPILDFELRYLQVEERQVEGEVAGKLEAVESISVGGETHTAWQEGAPRTVVLEPIPLRELLRQTRRFPFAAHAGENHEGLVENGQRRGRVTRERWALQGTLELSARPVGRWVEVRLRVENETRWRASDTDERAEALRRACIGTHALVGIRGGRFLSLADPPPEAAEAARSCRQQHCWPVLMGEPGAAETLLVSPIILDDHPRLAPESPGDLYDSAEIDEILTLRVMTLTEEEKAEARSTDERARRVIDRSEALPDEVFARLHGAIRSPRPAAPATASAEAAAGEECPGGGPVDTRSPSREVH